MLEGRTFQEASKGTDVPLKRAMAYRLLQAVRTQGKSALQDGRHGHPVKLRGAARTFLEEYCRQAPSTPSSVIPTLLQERFSLNMSISQIDRVRAVLGVSNCRKNQKQEKKRE
jgi:transposase